MLWLDRLDRDWYTHRESSRNTQSARPELQGLTGFWEEDTLEWHFFKKCKSKYQKDQDDPKVI